LPQIGIYLLNSEEIGVYRSVALPLLGQVLESENGSNRADRDACAAIDTLYRINIKLRHAFEAGFVLARVDAIHRANVHARGILGAGARFGDYISHSKSPFYKQRTSRAGVK
jgi:hypothetical protein